MCGELACADILGSSTGRSTTDLAASFEIESFLDDLDTPVRGAADLTPADGRAEEVVAVLAFEVWRALHHGRWGFSTSQQLGTVTGGPSKSWLPGGAAAAVFVVVGLAAAAGAAVAILSKISSKSWRADWITFCLVLRPR